MAVTETETVTETRATKRKLVCFSFAAYAKTLIAHLKSCNIPVAAGLSDAEFAQIESSFSFTFPPDLRSVLQAGLPISHGFPNWRSSSPQQLHILINLPVQGLLKEVADRRFWSNSRGPVGNRGDSVARARKSLAHAPVLIPVYRDLYIPASPAAAGNPVFYISGGDVRVSSFDLVGFFQDVEFMQLVGFRQLGVLRKLSNVLPPAWAAMAARRIEVWSDVAETGRRVVARGETRGWWRVGGEIGDCLEEVFWKLRDGGWSKEEVRDMMAIDGPDAPARSGPGVLTDVRRLGVVLSSAGWTREDIVYSLGFHVDYESERDQSGDTFFDFQQSQWKPIRLLRGRLSSDTCELLCRPIN